jgi:hypothetical protein
MDTLSGCNGKKVEWSLISLKKRRINETKFVSYDIILELSMAFGDSNGGTASCSGVFSLMAFYCIGWGR